MSYLVKHFPEGTFSWADVASKDINATKKFLTTLFGWTSQDMPTGIPGSDYTMFSLDGHYVAGGAAQREDQAALPSYWTNYIAVADADAVCATVTNAGGVVILPPMDVLESGRMAGIQDPTGATVFLWQARGHSGAGIVNTTGAMCWNELYTPDLHRAKQFYADVFGWTYAAMDGDADYFMIMNKGRMNGGMMAITPEMSPMPPMWMVYFTVNSIDETSKRVLELGGQVHMTRDVAQGTIAMITDPAGAAFMVIAMSVTPDEWTA